MAWFALLFLNAKGKWQSCLLANIIPAFESCVCYPLHDDIIIISVCKAILFLALALTPGYHIISPSGIQPLTSWCGVFTLRQVQRRSARGRRQSRHVLRRRQPLAAARSAAGRHHRCPHYSAR